MQVVDAEGLHLQLLHCFGKLKLMTWAAAHQWRGADKPGAEGVIYCCMASWVLSGDGCSLKLRTRGSCPGPPLQHWLQCMMQKSGIQGVPALRLQEVWQVECANG